jgi:hypothetical protein
MYLDRNLFFLPYIGAINPGVTPFVKASMRYSVQIRRVDEGDRAGAAEAI